MFLYVWSNMFYHFSFENNDCVQQTEPTFNVMCDTYILIGYKYCFDLRNVDDLPTWPFAEF